jgi:hypothetical protein
MSDHVRLGDISATEKVRNVVEELIDKDGGRRRKRLPLAR